MPNLSYFGIIEFPGSRTPLDFGVNDLNGGLTNKRRLDA